MAFPKLNSWCVEYNRKQTALNGNAIEGRWSILGRYTILPAKEKDVRLGILSDTHERLERAQRAIHLLQAQGAEALVHCGDLTGPGYRVLALTRVADGGLVVVDRGFLPQGRRDAGQPDVGEVAGLIDVVGVMRWPQARGFFAAQDDPARNLWFTRDHLAIAAAKGWRQRWGEIAPFFVDLELPAPAGGYPQPDALAPSIRNEHLQYALTWYGLAAVILVMYALWLANRASAAPQTLPCGSKGTPLC